MSDRVSAAPRRGVGRLLARGLADVVGVGAVAVLLGLGAARLWLAWSTPPPGGVQQGTWLYADLGAIEDVFDAVGVYVLLGLAAGAVLGVAAALLARCSPILTAVAVGIAALLAGEICRRSGLAMAPPNPRLFAAALPEGTLLPDTLRLPWGAPVVAWPIGALAGLAAVYLIRPFSRADRRRYEQQQEQQLRAAPAAWAPPSGSPSAP